MRRHPIVATLLVTVLGTVAVGVTSAPAQTGIKAKVTYEGSLGPVSGRRPLCLCVYFDAALLAPAGCLISASNAREFRINTGDTGDYYLIAFLDLIANEVPDPSEPYEIYRDHGAPPADVVTAMPGYATIDIAFGDENLSCLGDCDDSGAVTADDLVTMVGVDLDAATIDQCVAADRDDSMSITVDEIIAAIAAECRNL